MRVILALLMLVACGGGGSATKDAPGADGPVTDGAPGLVVAGVSITVSPTSTPADGTTAALLTVHVTSAQGVAIAGRAVTLATVAPGVSLSTMTGATDAAGDLVVMARSTRMGPTLVTADVDGVLGQVVVMFVAPACARSIELPGPARSEWGGAAHEMIAVDMNGDSKPDLVALDQTVSATVLRIGLGQGDGRFAPPTATAAGASRTGLVGGDFDEDTAIDLVMLDASTISMFRGNGDGTVAAPVTVPGPASLQDLATGDFNGDGHLDLAVATTGAVPITILLGAGDGTFAPGLPISAGATPYDIIAVQLGGDTKLDLVTSSLSGVVTTYAGNGDGTFQAPQAATTGGAVGVVAGDVNGDTHVDLVAVKATTDELSIQLGVGDGSLLAPVAIGNVGKPRHAVLLDLDATPGAEIALVDVTNELVTVVHHAGNGQFAIARSFEVGRGPRTAVTADLDGDGHADLVTGHDANAQVSVLLGDGATSLVAPSLQALGDRPSWVAMADLDKDGDLDVVAALNQSHQLVVLDGGGDGTYTRQATYPLGTYPREGAIADLDGDGWLDVVVTLAGSNAVSVSRNTGDGTLAAAVNYATGAVPVSVTVAHLDGDNILDLAVANNNSSSISILHGVGDATFTPAGAALSVSPGVYVNRVVSGDFDGDADVDLAFVTGGTGIQFNSRVVGLLRNQGDGNFAAPTTTAFNGVALETVAVADLDGDHQLDLIAGLWSGGAAIVMRGNGDGTFQAGVNYGLGQSSYRITSGDLDSDGHVDLIVTDQRAAEVRVLRGLGAAVFGPSQRYVGAAALDVAVGDLDGDERPDLVTADFTNTLSTRISRGCR